MKNHRYGSRPHRISKNSEAKKAAAAAGAGAVAGGITSASVGGMGLAVAGTGVGIGAAPLIAAGAVIGLAGYGLWRAFKK